MKNYSPTEIDSSIWQAVEFILMRSTVTEIVHNEGLGQDEKNQDKKSIERFHGGHAFDGLEPNRIETSKDGIKVTGHYWVLPSSEKYKVTIFFEKPSFTSIQSLTAKKLLKSEVVNFSINTELKQTEIRISQTA